MSAIDYLCCKKCYKKIFYDEHQDLLDYLETYHESKGLMCPDCSEQLERELAEARADLRLAKNIIQTHVERVAERDKLIEQMRAALVAAKNDGKMQSAITYQLIIAALSAAGRGE